MSLLTDIIYPPFIYKRSTYAAIFILLLLSIAFVFMLSSSEKTFDDINQDGEISWDEIYVAWKLPGTIHWWKYVIGIVFTGWAVMVSRKIYYFDKDNQKNE